MAGQRDELLQPPGLRRRHRAAERRDAVVPAPLVVFGGGRPPTAFLDGPLRQHSLDGAVERPRSELDQAPGALGDLLHDGIAVALGIEQREQDVELGGRQGKQSRGVARGTGQGRSVYIGSNYIVRRYSLPRSFTRAPVSP